jgi:uncharacterized protein (TIGR03663 family)
VSTASTKSRGSRNKRGQATKPSAKKRTEVPEAPPTDQISERSWLIAAMSVLAVGAFLRLYDLPLVPLHHDEGVNGNFLVRLVRDGFYQYDPGNYHGPTLYYFAAVIPWTIRFLFGVDAQNAYGLTTFNIRLVTALFGLGTIWLVLLLRRHLGSVGALSGAALLAVSPGAVYLSRYFIHESLFVFFTFAIVVAGLRYYEEGRPLYLILLAASLGLLFATKETWIISVGVLIIALVSTHLYPWLAEQVTGSSRRQRRRDEVDYPRLSEWASMTIDRIGGPLTFALWLAGAIVIAVAVGVLFYSSFTTNWKGVYDSLKTFDVWTRTGQTAHVHERWTYVAKWLPFQEAPLLVLGAIGAALVVWQPKNRFALFAALWAFGIIAAYSLVPYKTPWLILNFIVPLALISGYAIEWAYQQLQRLELDKIVAMGAAMVVWVVVSGVVPNAALWRFHKPLNPKTAIPLYQTVDLNFVNYDNDDDYYVYVYAHTRRDLLKLVADIDRIARRTDKPSDLGITIVSPEYWPLPWYFRDYQRVGYYAHMSASTEPVIIASETQRVEAEATFGSRYRQIQSGLNPKGSFALRPGVDLLLYLRRDVPDP